MLFLSATLPLPPVLRLPLHLQLVQALLVLPLLLLLLPLVLLVLML